MKSISDFIDLDPDPYSSNFVFLDPDTINPDPHHWFQINIKLYVEAENTEHELSDANGQHKTKTEAMILEETGREYDKNVYF